MPPALPAQVLREAVRAACEDAAAVGLAFSGGLDSSLVAGLARENTTVIPYTVGYPDSPDLQNAEEAADLLALPWVPLLLEDDALSQAAAELLQNFPSLDPVSLSFELPLWIVLQRAEEDHILAGQGADELFAGYARYDTLRPEDVEPMLQRDLLNLHQETLPREGQMAHLWAKELRLPYCDPAVLTAVIAIPASIRGAPPRKAVLRRLAADLGLPSELVNRPKKAAQYGSGVMKRLKALARGDGKTVQAFLDDLRPAP